MIVSIEDGKIAGYCTIAETSMKWGIPTYSILDMIGSGKIRNVIKLSVGRQRNAWFIPENAPKPL